MTAEASYLNDPAASKEVASGALSGGEVQQMADSRAAFVEGLQAIAANDMVSLRKYAVAKFACASGTTFSKGDPVYWNATTNLAVAPALSLDGSTIFYLGVAHKAKTSGQLVVEVEMNVQPVLPAIPLPFVFEFDCETGVDAATHVLVPAAYNKRGLLLLAAYALVTEVFAGASEDQGIVTVEDTDGTDLCTLTASDAGADAANDVIVGTSDLFSATTGDAAKVVAAGKGIRGVVSQATSGAGAAGKMKVYVLVMPLV